MPNDEINGVIKPQDITGGIVDNSGSIDANISDNSGTISAGVSAEDGTLSGSLNAENSPLSANVNSDTSSFGTTLTVSYGADGKPGKDGFSPTINVHEQTETSYILKVTDVNGSYLTPNLMANGSIVLDGYVVENLEKYPQINPVTLNATDRESVYVYAHNDANGANRKIALSDIALETEVADRFRTKIRTVKERPDEDWRIGDYIFLETGDGE